jgi:uncharacterized membrane protein
VFSLGLGLAQFLAPQTMSKICGIKDAEGNASFMRALGAREISHGVAILSRQQPEKALWSRVAGDALDLALLGKVMANPENSRGRALFATANVLAVTALDVMAARTVSQQPRTVANEGADKGIIRTKRSLTVNKSPEECYAFWHNFENLPQFMRHLESVTVTGERRSHWKAKAPAGATVEWDAETTEDRPNELIAWRSTEDADVFNAGTVRFEPAPGGRGTEVRIELGIQATPREARLQGGDAVPRGAGPAGDGRPAPLQAGDGDRRDPLLRRHEAARPAPGAAGQRAGQALTAVIGSRSSVAGTRRRPVIDG